MRCLKGIRSFALCFALSACLGVAHVSAQSPANDLHTASRTELDVVKVILTQERAWNDGNIDAYLQEYKNSPDTIFIGTHVDRGYNQIADDYKHNYDNRAAMGTLGYSELEVHSLGADYAVCIGKYHLERTKKEGGPADGLFSIVMEKTAAGWKIVLDHTT